MTNEEYINAVKTALAELDKSDKDAVHAFNVWRANLYEELKSQENHYAKKNQYH